MARKKKIVVAVEGQHYRHRLDGNGRHVFVCIGGEHKPRSFASFAGFQTHMHKLHQLLLPEELLERGKPWLPSKSDFSSCLFTAAKKAPPVLANEASWNRLRSTVQLRWRMCKTRKKYLLKSKYFIATEEPVVPAKSVLVRLLRSMIFRGGFGRRRTWAILLDPKMYDKLQNDISNAGVSNVVGKWVDDVLQQIPSNFPQDRKLKALQMDCHLLQSTFPRSGDPCGACEEQHLRAMRETIIQDALQFMKAKRDHLQWKQAPKFLDFQGAVADYRQWKVNHKDRSIEIASTNVLSTYLAQA